MVAMPTCTHCARPPRALLAHKGWRCARGGCRVSSSLWQCVECEFVGCDEHLHRHTEHAVFAHAVGGWVWCGACRRVVVPAQAAELAVLRDVCAVSPPGSDIAAITRLVLQQKVVPSLEPSIARLPERRGVVGLSNLGNTCFLNSTVQAMLACRALGPLLMAHAATTQPSQRTVASQLLALVEQTTQQPPKPHLSPSSLLSAVHRQVPAMSGYHQQDAQEFMRLFADTVHEQLKVRCASATPENDDADARPSASSSSWLRLRSPVKHRPPTPHNKGEEEWYSPISDVFGGTLLSRVTCKACGHNSDTFEPFFDLSLSLPHNQRGELTLRHCLDEFCGGEVLSGDNAYQCDKCHRRTTAERSLMVARLPDVICFHLKRFKHSPYTAKLTQHVAFPLSNLDMAPFASARHEAALYDLQSVVVHSGTHTGGHYIAYVRDHHDQWVVCNDSAVQAVSPHTVQACQAYMLFYQRRRAVHSSPWQHRYRGSLSSPQMLVSASWLPRCVFLSVPPKCPSLPSPLRVCAHGFLAGLPSEWPKSTCAVDAEWVANVQTNLGIAVHAAVPAVCAECAGLKRPDYAALAASHQPERESPLGQGDMASQGKPSAHASANSNGYGNGRSDRDRDENRGDVNRGDVKRRADRKHRRALEEEGGAGAEAGLWERRVEEQGTIKRCEKDGEYKENSVWYLIDREWLKTWRAFVKGGPLPDAISNHELLRRLERDEATPDDYRGVHKASWRALHAWYGGGPTLRRKGTSPYEGKFRVVK